MSTPEPNPLALPAHVCLGTCGRLVADASRGSLAWTQRDVDANAHLLANFKAGMCNSCELATRARPRFAGPARPSDEENRANLEAWAARRRHAAATARQRRAFHAAQRRQSMGLAA